MASNGKIYAPVIATKFKTKKSNIEVDIDNKKIHNMREDNDSN